MFKRVYFDNAASSYPKPQKVLYAVRDILNENTSNAGRSGHYMSEKLAAKIYDVRKKIAAFFGTDETLVVFTQNATHAINLLFFGLLKSGDEVIISDLEHNAVLRPLTALQRQGVSLKIFKTGENSIKNCEELITNKTKLIFVTGASNVTGEVLPVPELAAVAKKHGIYFGVDAAQSAGVISYNLQNDNIDFLCATAHKSLMGIQGAGFLAMKNATEIMPLIYGGTGFESLNPEQPLILPEGLESGTLMSPAIIGLGAAIDYISENKKSIYEKEKMLYSYVYDKLSANNLIIIYSQKTFGVPTLSFNVGNKNSENVCEYLSNNGVCLRGGYHCALLAHQKLGTTDQGVCRLSFSPFNNISEIDYFCDLLRPNKISNL
ncbi:MAG: aminotransferase class V-fold PLP-dependent enzyme [Clostridiales bacterium]|nr:MAG: aminotransferase class V-fold PLP-dependent enzyme [Clostridiales bacterium]